MKPISRIGSHYVVTYTAVTCIGLALLWNSAHAQNATSPGNDLSRVVIEHGDVKLWIKSGPITEKYIGKEAKVPCGQTSLLKFSVRNTHKSSVSDALIEEISNELDLEVELEVGLVGASVLLRNRLAKYYISISAYGAMD